MVCKHVCWAYFPPNIYNHLNPDRVWLPKSIQTPLTQRRQNYAVLPVLILYIYNIYRYNLLPDCLIKYHISDQINLKMIRYQMNITLEFIDH